MDQHELCFNLSGPRGPGIRRQGRTDRWPPGGGPRARESCGGPGTRVASESALTVAGAAAPGQSPIVEETARSAHHSSSRSELLPRQSPQQSQRSLTAAVAVKLTYSRNQPVYHTLNLSR